MGVLHAFIEAIEQLRSPASHVPGIVPSAQEAFLFCPFILLLVPGVAAGTAGTLVNLRRVEFNTETMVHSVFPGIVAGSTSGDADAIPLGAPLTALLVVAAPVLVEHTEAHHEDGTVVVLATFFGFGIMVSLKKGGMSGQLEALMFGRPLEIVDAGLLQSLIVCLLVLLLVIVTWKENILVAHDCEGTGATGVNLLAIDLVLNYAIAAIVISASSTVGVLLVIAYLVVPGTAGRLISASVGRMCVISILVAILGEWLGMHPMLVPTPHPVSPQAAVVLSVVALLVLIITGLKIYTIFRKTVAPKVKASAEGELQGVGAQWTRSPEL